MPQGREFTITTPLGPDTLLFSRMQGHDAIGECFAFDIDMISEDLDIAAADLLGQGITLRIGHEDEEPVFLHGLVDRLSMIEITDRQASYRAQLRPWLWFLSKSTDNRIFQNLSIVEIIEEVFAAYPAAKFENRLQNTYDPIPYCVQYGESDLDFLMRWMEHEGIFTFFEFEDGAHTLILVDTLSALAPADGQEQIAFSPDLPPSFENRDFITRWTWDAQVTTGEFTHTDYDFTKPAADLMGKSVNPGEHDLGDLEAYHYPGTYTELDRGDALAVVRMQTLKSPCARACAQATARGIHSGHLFELTDFWREAENAEYAILRTDYDIWDGQYAALGRDVEEGFQITLALTLTTEEYRPPRITPKPVMRGPQTAVVVGPSGEEIFTDEYARVKVQFHWDRLGANDENSSCFVRVSAAWAGSGYGFIQIPRIGQEVIVDFLEGDPDQPIITGRVYNAAQMPPYGLPGSATQSGWKSDSSPGGGGYNELRFEDKAGSEEVYFQAQKDHNELIKNNESRLIQNDFSERVDNNATQSIGVDRAEDVGNNKTTEIGVNRTVTIGNDDTESVGANRSLSVGADETISVAANSSEDIGANHSQTVGANQSINVTVARTDNVGAAESRIVGAAQSQVVGAARTVTVGADQSHTIGSDNSWTIAGNESQTIAGNRTEDVGGNETITLKGDQSWTGQGGRTVKVSKGQIHDVTEDVMIKSGKAMVLEAADSIVLKCGSAVMTLKKDGTITVEGKDISFDASGKFNVKAGGDITMKGSKINQN
ncbi:type VI secretion system tip protein TssI/VgrG [Cognatiyoonia sp. IB215446]|uniref:type VI secretion system Vgr family protein n=1 Tax=Cognatiyoonia sp. IB215446 TaxID=3097355 RepID=UPI002A0CF03B|nr:type VI secretion system tip protein TssI/VgrG [Cognatiyoonia sp. IB215446]MDX8346591.1 type VI secretion system tip protein TssI/VgrG [Cognatiyoonia sp. IB215446]